MKKNGLVVFLLIVIFILAGLVCYMYISNDDKDVSVDDTKTEEKVNYDKTFNLVLNNNTHRLSYVKGNTKDDGKYIQYTLKLYFDDKEIDGGFLINEGTDDITIDTFKGTNKTGALSEYAILSFRDTSFVHHYIIDETGCIIFDAGGVTGEGITLKETNKEYLNSDITIEKDVMNIYLFATRKNVNVDVIKRIERKYKDEIALIHQIYVNSGIVYDYVEGIYNASEYIPMGR